MVEPVILIIISGGDIASTNQAKSLLEKCEWVEGNLVEGFNTWNCHTVRIWWRDGGVLFEDNLDLRWESETGEKVSEVIYSQIFNTLSDDMQDFLNKEYQKKEDAEAQLSLF